MQRVRVRERVYIGDLAVQREFLDLVEVDLVRSAGVSAEMVAAAVHEDGLQPGRSGFGSFQLAVALEAFQEAVLHRVLGVVTDQPRAIE